MVWLYLSVTQYPDVSIHWYICDVNVTRLTITCHLDVSIVRWHVTVSVVLSVSMYMSVTPYCDISIHRYMCNVIVTSLTITCHLDVSIIRWQATCHLDVSIIRWQATVSVVLSEGVNQYEIVDFDLVVNVVFARGDQRVSCRWIPIKERNLPIVTSEAVKGLALMT